MPKQSGSRLARPRISVSLGTWFGGITPVLCRGGGKRCTPARYPGPRSPIAAPERSARAGPTTARGRPAPLRRRVSGRGGGIVPHSDTPMGLQVLTWVAIALALALIADGVVSLLRERPGL